MANANTVAAVYNVPKVVLNTSTETIITKGIVPVQVGFGPQDNFDGGRPFTVNVRGTATGGTSATLILKVYLASASTIGTSTAVAAFTISGAAIPVAGSNFDLSADFAWDSTSGTINGYVYGQTAGTLTPYALSASPTGITTVDGLQFVVSAKFGAAVATNSVSLTELSISAR